MFIDIKFFKLNNLDLIQITRLYYKLREEKILNKHKLIFRIRFARFA
jgi:hypothetical protein